MISENNKIAFVINPAAGIKKKIDISEFIKRHFTQTIPYDIILWENKNDIETVKEKIIYGNYTTVVACGGDGTVNFVASIIVNTKMALGILPLGSGNGLARSNFISMDLKKALKIIADGKIKIIDGALLNGKPFFCTAGIGFDALIADRFAASTKRGFATYFKTSCKEFFSYQSKNYKITVDEKKFEFSAFLITVANAGQWGNNVYISPEASLNDGILNVSILKPFSKFSIPGIAIKLFSKKIHTSKNFLSLKGKSIDIEFSGKLPVHFDGEPIVVENKLHIEIMQNALKIVC